MKIENLFPHPIGEVSIDYDNEQLIKDVESAVETTENRNNWQCEIISSFQNHEMNDEVFSNHTSLLEQVAEAGNNFMKEVGWYDGDLFVGDWWFNLYQNEHWQEQHHHGVHDLCAIYYATPDIVPTLFQNPNNYTFHARYHQSKKTEFTKNDYQSLAQPGKLILFPGYLMHSVPYKTNREIAYLQRRLTVAFNFVGNNNDRLQKLLDKDKQLEYSV